MSNVAVSLAHIVKTHGATIAVDGVSLEVYQGEFFSILGPSGSGKTTLLRVIAGFERPDQGVVSIQGRVMTSRPPHLRPANMVFQNYALFPHLTVEENVGFGLRMQKRPESEIDSAVKEILALVKLQDHRRRYPAHLSGGEQQRVAIARALVNRPAVLLLDEPLGALDQQLRQEMQVELKTLQEQVQSTFICVTHHQEEAMMLSDRVAVLQKGKVLQVGTPQAVYDSPASFDVARFIGLSNLLRGRVGEGDGVNCRLVHPHIQPILMKRPSSIAANGDVLLIVRPERLEVVEEASRNGYANTLPARVVKAVFHGNEMVYHLALSNELVWVARVPQRSLAPPPFRVGQPVYVQWRAEDSLVFAP